VESEPRSLFLEEAEPNAVRAQCDALQSVSDTAPDALTPIDAVRFCAAVGALGLERYIRTWWTADAAYRAALLEQAKHAESTLTSQLQAGNATELLIPVTKRNDLVSATRPFTFAASSHTKRIEVYQRDRRIGFVDPERSDMELPLDVLPWDTLSAHLARRTESGRTLYLRPGTTPKDSNGNASGISLIDVLSKTYQRGRAALEEAAQPGGD
jgi:hypothetical protein